MRFAKVSSLNMHIGQLAAGGNPLGASTAYLAADALETTSSLLRSLRPALLIAPEEKSWLSKAVLLAVQLHLDQASQRAASGVTTTSMELVTIPGLGKSVHGRQASEEL